MKRKLTGAFALAAAILGNGGHGDPGGARPNRSRFAT